MLRIALEQFAGPSGVASAGGRRFGFFARLPDLGGGLDSDNVGQFQLRQSGPKTRVGSIAGIGQHHTLRDASLLCAPDLIQCDLRLSLKLNPVGNAGLFASFTILNPRLRQVQTVGHRHTRLFSAHRKADRYTAVVLFTDLTAILTGHSH